MDSLPPKPPSSTPAVPAPNAKHADGIRYDPQFLWQVFVKCGGSFSEMMKIDDPAIPKSLRTIQAYAKREGWKKRFADELEKQGPQVGGKAIAKSKLRLERLEQIEEAVFAMVVPKKDPITGDMKWPLPPSKFEATLAQFLKLLDRIEVLSGGVTSRTEVKTIVEVNVHIICTTFGKVMNEFIQEGVINHKVARQVIDRFSQRIRTHEIVLDAAPKEDFALPAAASPNQNESGEDSEA